MNIDQWVKFIKVLRYNSTPYWQGRIDKFLEEQGVFRQPMATPVDIVKEEK